MNKKLIEVKNLLHLEDVKKKVNDAFSAGKAEEAAAAIRALIDELERMEVEVDYEELNSRILELIKGAEPNQKTEEAIANAIAKRMQAVMNAPKSNELPALVKNQIAAAVLRSTKEQTEQAVKDVLVRNGITGMTFENVVDYSVVENWGDLNPIFSQLHKTMYTKFFYDADPLLTKALLPKQWDKSSTAEKIVQTISTEGKTISTKYVYARQQMAFEDLDDVEQAGETTNLLRFINEELDRMIVNGIVMAMLIGDTTNDSGKRITSFETIGNKTNSDAFTTVSTAASANTCTLKDLRTAADNVKNPLGKKKIAIMSNEILTEAAEFTYGTGGSISYRTKEEVAMQIGVDEIITVDIMPKSGGVYAIFMLPDGYWYKEKKALSVSYAKYENNVMNYQKERNIGGGIHDLYSTSVLKAHA